MNTITKQTIGFLSAAIGTAIRILLAPQKGKSTRNKIKSQANGVKEKLNNFSKMQKENLIIFLTHYNLKKKTLVSEIETEFDAFK
jgi:gas vesicle protein